MADACKPYESEGVVMVMGVLAYLYKQLPDDLGLELERGNPVAQAILLVEERWVSGIC